MYWQIISGGSFLGVLTLTLASVKWCLPASRWTSIVVLATILGALGALGADRSGLTPWMTVLLVWALQGTSFVTIVVWMFFRDPERAIPSDASVVVSPADGRVIHVRRLEPGEPLRSAKNGAVMQLTELQGTDLARHALWHIGISMVFTDVHVNRAPIAGRVVRLHHRPGQFLSLRSKEAVRVNERQTIVIDNGAFQVGLVQIASRLVRQIVAYVSPGDALQLGQRVGMIRFGSQVDLFLPVSVAPDLEVAVGESLTAGETIICRLRSTAATVAARTKAKSAGPASDPACLLHGSGVSS
jgi:phosphatidylserine decarboxylase